MLTLLIDRKLQREGWSPSYDPTSEIWGGRLYAKGYRTIIVIKSDRLGQPDDPSNGHFEGIRDILEGSAGTITDVVFPGGGTLTIPDWFRDWCKTHGIRIHVLDDKDALPENLVEQAPPPYL